MLIKKTTQLTDNSQDRKSSHPVPFPLDVTPLSPHQDGTMREAPMIQWLTQGIQLGPFLCSHAASPSVDRLPTVAGLLVLKFPFSIALY